MTENRYLNWLSCPGMPEELKKELRSMDQKTIRDCFCRNLEFGTGGLRGVLGAGTNRMNVYTVLKATKGLAHYLLGRYSAPVCVIGYDSRIHSFDFTLITAAALAELGITVWIFPRLEPTPMLSFAVRHLSASAGIMITASHNPSRFNGYKVYGSDGCQITSHDADQIMEEISRQPELSDSLPDFSLYRDSGLIRQVLPETIEAYYQAVLSLRVGQMTSPLHVIYSPLNGTGNEPVREILSRIGQVRVDPVPEQELPDGQFPTCPVPNPEMPEAMSLLYRDTLSRKADFCFATDPDCDRLGVGVRLGDRIVPLSGNDVGILLLDYLCRRKALNPALPPVVVKTIVTTDMALPLCAKYGVEVRNVLTGFKYIGEQIGLLEKDGQLDRFLFGFEESCGYLSGTDVRDKDAVNAVLLLCGLASELKSQNRNLLDRLQELRSEFGCYVQRLLSYQFEGADGMDKMNAIMNSLRSRLSDANRFPLPLTGYTDYLQDNTGLPKSNVIEFRLAEEQKIIIRPSGTEPKLKVYLFARNQTQDQGEQSLDRLQAQMNNILK